MPRTSDHHIERRPAVTCGLYGESWKHEIRYEEEEPLLKFNFTALILTYPIDHKVAIYLCLCLSSVVRYSHNKIISIDEGYILHVISI